MVMWWLVLETLINFIQIFIIYKVFDLYYKRRLSFVYSVEVVIVIMAGALTLLNYNFQIQQIPLLYIAFYILILITTAIIFKGNIFLKISMLFLIIAATGTLEMLSAVLITTISKVGLKAIQEQSQVRIEVAIISQTFFIYFYMLLKEKHDLEKMNYLKNKYYIHAGSILFLTVMVMIIIAYLYGNIDYTDDSINKTLLILTLCVSMLSIVSISLTNQILNDMSEKHKNEMELQQIKLEKVYFTDVNAALEEIRILKHDMRGELALIHGYNELNQRDKVRLHIEKKLQEMDVQLTPQIDSENIITSFLNFKLKEAKSKNINIEIISNFADDEEIYIDKGDICRVINNIINNIIEALLECGLKNAKLFMGILSGYFIIKSENPYRGSILTDRGNIITIKKDKAKHGYGLKSIKSIAEKYNGVMNIDYDDKIFKINVEMLNSKAQENSISDI